MDVNILAIYELCQSIPGTGQGQLGTSRDKQEQGRDNQEHGREKKGQAGTNRDSFFFPPAGPCLSLLGPASPCLSLTVPVGPCLSLFVPVCPCPSMSVPACPCLSLSVPVCPYICSTWNAPPADEYHSLPRYEHCLCLQKPPFYSLLYFWSCFLNTSFIQS